MTEPVQWAMLAIVVGACLTSVGIVVKVMLFFMNEFKGLATKEDIHRLNLRLDLQFNSSVELVERVAKLEGAELGRGNGRSGAGHAG